MVSFSIFTYLTDISKSKLWFDCQFSDPNTYPEIILKPVSQNDTEKQTESTKDISKNVKPVARRSRIKPTVTPVARKRNTSKSKTVVDSKDDNDASGEIPCSSELSDPKGRVFVYSSFEKNLRLHDYHFMFIQINLGIISNYSVNCDNNICMTINHCWCI